MPEIVIPYTPRPIWKETIHPSLEKYRFAVIVAHRRFGKTVGNVNHLIKSALLSDKPSPVFVYLGPFRNQAKMIAWSYLKYYTSVIPNRKVNESELYIEMPTKHIGRPGARIYVIGADNPDSLRGIYIDGVIIDEYAQIKKKLWGEVVRPALADRLGWAVFIGTPHGQNQFYEIYQRAIKNKKEWFAAVYRYDETGILSSEEIESMKEAMTSEEFRQEMLCDFSASDYNILISIDLVTVASNKSVKPTDYRNAPLIYGVDVARYGNDSSCLVKRKGKVVYPLRRYKGIDNMELAAQIAFQASEDNPDAIFVDAGRGEGVIDRLKQLGFNNIIEINFGGSAIDKDRYLNKRAEMWVNARNWLMEGGSLPNDADLKTELTAPEYFITEQGKMKLESKENIKEKIGRSTDGADAFALTFAQPVMAKGLYETLGRQTAKRKTSAF